MLEGNMSRTVDETKVWVRIRFNFQPTWTKSPTSFWNSGNWFWIWWLMVSDLTDWDVTSGNICMCFGGQLRTCLFLLREGRFSSCAFTVSAGLSSERLRGSLEVLLLDSSVLSQLWAAEASGFTSGSVTRGEQPVRRSECTRLIAVSSALNVLNGSSCPEGGRQSSSLNISH